MKRHAFDLLMELETADIRLDCASFHLARDVYPQIDILSYLDTLDNFAAEVAETRCGLSANMRYAAMREVLVERHGFVGNEDDYCDPENSYLNRVIDRRVGLPISLSIVWLEVSRRLKWPVRGIGFPGHFIIRFDDKDRFLLVDPFHKGRTLSLEHCRKLLAQNTDEKIRFSKQHLRPVDTRAILSRCLSNLRSIYMAHQDWSRLRLVLERLSATEPESASHIQELAALHYCRGDLRTAYAHLRTYAERKPGYGDIPTLRGQMHHLSAAIVAMN